MKSEVFPYKTKASIHLSKWGVWVYGAQSWTERELLYEFMFVLFDKWALILKNGRKKVFLIKPEYQYHLSQWGESVYGAQTWKERRLLCKSMFVPIDWWALI